MAGKLSDIPIDPIGFLKECKDAAQLRGESKKAQEIRTLIWKVQDLSEVPGKKEEIGRMLAEAGLIESGQAEAGLIKSGLIESGLIESRDKPTKPSEASSTEKLIRTNEKKLKDIQKLKEKQKSGVSLEKNQLDKIGKEEELRKELDDLRSIVERVASEAAL